MDFRIDLANTYEIESAIRMLKAQLMKGIPVSYLELSAWAHNCLRREGINTVEQLCEMRSEDLMAFPGCGKRSVEDIKNCLAWRGYRLASK